MFVHWSSLYKISYRHKDNLINDSISILVTWRGGKVVSLDISVNLMVKRLILVLCKSEHYFKTSACNLLGRDVAG